jgi:hypothetical protein
MLQFLQVMGMFEPDALIETPVLPDGCTNHCSLGTNSLGTNKVANDYTCYKLPSVI